MIRYKSLTSPISVQLELTEKCNNNCIHCYNHWRIDNNNLVSLDIERLGRILDQLIVSKVMMVTLTGGEPLICKELVLYAISRLQEAGIATHLNSNLSLLSYHDAIELKKRGLQSILTSLLSWKKETHNQITGNIESFDKTIQGISQAIEAGLRISVNMVVSQVNFDHIYQTAEFVKNIGAQSFSATKVTPSLRLKNFHHLKLSKEQVFKKLEELERIKEILNIPVDILECYPLCLFKNVERFQYFARRSCSAGKTACTIGANGEVRPCSHSDLSYGSIFDNDLCCIWERMFDWRQAQYIYEICKMCQYLAQCSGGCRMEAKYFTNICGADPYMNSQEEVHNLPPKKSIPLIPYDQPLYLQKGIKFRKESFGVLLYNGKLGSVFITYDSYNLLLSIEQYDSFTIRALKEKQPYEIEDIQSFLSILVSKKFIIQL